MFKLLVNSPSGDQRIEYVDETGDYFDKSRILWDERKQGALPDVALGKVQIVDGAIQESADYLPDHAAFVRLKMVPPSVTRRQIRLALLDAKMLDAADVFVSGQSEEVQIHWNDSQEFYRKHPLIIGLSATFGLTETQVDDIFIAASQK